MSKFIPTLLILLLTPSLSVKVQINFIIKDSKTNKNTLLKVNKKANKDDLEEKIKFTLPGIKILESEIDKDDENFEKLALQDVLKIFKDKYYFIPAITSVNMNESPWEGDTYNALYFGSVPEPVDLPVLNEVTNFSIENQEFKEIIENDIRMKIYERFRFIFPDPLGVERYYMPEHFRLVRMAMGLESVDEDLV